MKYFRLSAPNSNKIEILLEQVTPIQKYFNFDAEQKDKSKKFFSNILYGYLDNTSGLKITFYVPGKYKGYVSKYYKEKDARQNDLSA